MSAPGTQRLEIPIDADEWLLQNHRVHYQQAAKKRGSLRVKTGWLAKAQLLPAQGPVAVYARVRMPKGTLPDADAAAPMVKAAIDGLVDAGIIPDDNGQWVPLVGYGRPERDRTLKTRTLSLVITDQYVPF